MTDLASFRVASPGHAPSTDPAGPVGVGGWLLVLCLMFTLIGPLIAAGVMAAECASLAPRLADSLWRQTLAGVSVVLQTCGIVIGVHAGLRLWSVRPGAVDTAKRALLIGLAVSVVTTGIGIAIAPASASDSDFLRELMLGLVPDAIFFTLCYAYLNRSLRVHRTYRS